MNQAPKHPVPVFPLPGVVLFPHAVLPLHIYELRYRTMVRDALSGERLIALATLLPGWEQDYEGSPAFHELGCIGRVEEIEWLPNDCYDLKLRGVVRARFTRVVREFPYRACEVEVLPSAPFEADDPLADMERDALLDQIQKLRPLGLDAWFTPLAVAPDAPFETLVNVVAQCARLDVASKMELLGLESVFERSRLLTEKLRLLFAPIFPPVPPVPPPADGGAEEGGRWN
ncbi:MAG: LON peptidase substrate-binding domain-containing protein [Candidatus Eisenbacteria bacterium]